MNSGSMPCAPRYLELTASACAPPGASPRLAKSPLGEPVMRVLMSLPDSRAITCSTGPPGANCTTTKATSMIPNMVGIMNSRRRMI
jgi:hypothetical protein